MKRFLLFVVACVLASSLAIALASGGRIAAFLAAEPPFALALALSAALAATCFLFGLVTGDYSWVDRLWSIVPVAFAWIYAARASFDWRASVGAALVTLWGARLTRNFARRGGYSGTEDYRWSVLRDRIRSPLAWQAFNAIFICAAQLGVIALFSSPLARLGEGEPSPLAFAGAALLCLAFLAYETEADREQWEFQARKGATGASAAGAASARGATPGGGAAEEEVARGFRSSGLFRLSRHPAYFGELGFWWSIYLVGAAGSGSLLHWSVAGAAALTALFVGSTRFTESLSAAKYPAYAEYRRTTSAIVPWLPRRPHRRG